MTDLNRAGELSPLGTPKIIYSNGTTGGGFKEQELETESAETHFPFIFSVDFYQKLIFTGFLARTWRRFVGNLLETC